MKSVKWDLQGPSTHIENVNMPQIYRPVAQESVGNTDAKPSVDHIDHKKTVKYITNLRWVSTSETSLNMVNEPTQVRNTNVLTSTSELINGGHVI